MKKKSFIALLTALTLSSAYIPNAKAETIQDKQQQLSNLQQQTLQTQQQIIAQQKQATTVQGSIDAYQKSLTNVETSIVTNQQEINDLQNQIAALNTQIEDNKQKLTLYQSQISSTLKSFYDNGNLAFLNFLLTSQSIYDFLERLDDVKTVSRSYLVLKTNLTNTQTTLSNEEKAQETDYQSLQNKNQELEILKQSDLTLKNQKTAELAQLNASIQSNVQKQSTLESQIKLTQDQIAQIEEETKQAEAEAEARAKALAAKKAQEEAARQQTLASQSSGSTSSNQGNSSFYSQQSNSSSNGDFPSVNAQSIIQYAERFEGLPYVWGGTTPSGFDCSGFTQYVFGHFGVSINRTSQEQFAQGIPVSRDNLKPGDLVFFSTYAPGATHVGIYMGGGLMIDSQDSGVSIDSVFGTYWGSRYIGARQIINH